MLPSRSWTFALRLRTLPSRPIAPVSFINSFASRQRLGYRLAHRQSSFLTPNSPHTPTNTPSFAIAAAFEGHEDLEDDDASTDRLDGQETDGKEPTLERTQSLDEHFQRGLEKKKRWMQSLVSEKVFETLVKSVADCYAPLYKAMGLEGQCPLLAVATSERACETEFQPQRFDEKLTKLTEQEAMALLVISKQASLAVAIVEHRDKLAEELLRRAATGTGVLLPGTSVTEDRKPVTLGSHFRMFYSWAMSAYALCGRKYHTQLFDTYKRAQDAGVYVSANMNVQYICALIAEKRFDEVFEFYELVLRERLPTTMFFYRNLLFAVSVTHRVELLDSILEDMRVKGFKLRADDYLHSIRTYDNEYYLTRVQSRDKRQLNQRRRSDRETKDCETKDRETKDRDNAMTTPRDTYQMCVNRYREQEEHPERFEKMMDAVENVLGLFDAMVELDGLAPQHEQLFPRVITAAVYAQECERIPDLLALHAANADTRLHYAGVRMAVNALLLLEKPTEAWELVRETNPSLEPRRYALLGNIFSYYCIKKRGADIIELMHDTEELKLEGAFTLSLIKNLLPALCSSIDSVSDEKLMETVTHFDNIFRVRTSEHHFGVFLRECCHSKRLAVVKAALKQWLLTSENKMPIKGTLALKLLETFERESDWAFMAKVFEVTDFSRVNREDDRKAIVSAVSRAYQSLGEPERAKRAERISLVAGKRQKVVQQRTPMQQQKARGKRPSRSTASSRNLEPVVVNGVPVTSSSS